MAQGRAAFGGLPTGEAWAILELAREVPGGYDLMADVRRRRARSGGCGGGGRRVAGLEVLTDLGWEPRTEPCGVPRGLHEG